MPIMVMKGFDDAPDPAGCLSTMPSCCPLKVMPSWLSLPLNHLKHSKLHLAARRADEQLGHQHPVRSEDGRGDCRVEEDESH